MIFLGALLVGAENGVKGVVVDFDFETVLLVKCLGDLYLKKLIPEIKSPIYVKVLSISINRRIRVKFHFRYLVTGSNRRGFGW